MLISIKKKQLLSYNSTFLQKYDWENRQNHNWYKIRKFYHKLATENSFLIVSQRGYSRKFGHDSIDILNFTSNETYSIETYLCDSNFALEFLSSDISFCASDNLKESCFP